MIRLTPILFVCLFLPGCYRTEVLKPEQLKDNATYDLIIARRDGSKVSMKAGDYELIRERDSLLAIQGHGREESDTLSSDTQAYNGRVYVNDTSRTVIVGTKRTLFNYLIPAAVIALTVFWVWL